ncbi:MAG: right-handed parallel beta-helix repeat-containing protein [Methylocella sp.]
MINITSSQAIAGALLACGLSAAPAQAGPNRTFVSGRGTDSGTCTRTAPCRTFAFALTQTAAGGEIDVLDTAGYGSVTINKAISIVNDGVGTAGITTGSGNGVTINAGASDSVHLRGLTIVGPGISGTNGIAFNTGGNLEIENCVIRNFQGGIVILASTSSSFSVSNTIASNNGGGIGIEPNGSAVVTGVLSNVIADDNDSGISVEGKFTTGASLNVVIADSETSNNAMGTGVEVGSVSGAALASVLIRNIVARNNAIGLGADANSTLRVGHSVITGNGTAAETTGSGVIFTYGDNNSNGNTVDNFGTLTKIATQ